MYGTASRHNHELLSALGATPIDYRSEDFLDRIRELTGDGVDAVFDPVGGARHLWRSYRALRKGGRLVWFGMAATKRKGLKVIPATLLMQGLLALRRNGRSAPLMPDLGAFTEANHAWYQDTLTEFLNLLEEDKIKPVVAERVPLLEASRAHELLERGGYGGKVVLIAAV
jgi:NADPH2:quinone reductase